MTLSNTQAGEEHKATNPCPCDEGFKNYQAELQWKVTRITKWKHRGKHLKITCWHLTWCYNRTHFSQFLKYKSESPDDPVRCYVPLVLCKARRSDFTQITHWTPHRHPDVSLITGLKSSTADDLLIMDMLLYYNEHYCHNNFDFKREKKNTSNCNLVVCCVSLLSGNVKKWTTE